MDHYKTLGVAKNASPEEIKQAYRKLASKHHPDKGGDTAAFQKIQQAYETLSNPDARQEHDNPNPFGHHGGHPGFNFNVNGFDMNDIFGHMFGQQTRRQQTPTYRTSISVTLEQVYSGFEQMLQLGTHNGTHVVKIQVPKGVQHGSTIKYDNLIKDSILLVDFHIAAHPQFEREGNNLYSVHDIDIFDLIVGSTFEFKTISGRKLTVTVPAKTQTGSKLRLAKEGMPFNDEYGDQYILLKPYIPAIIDSAITDSILQARSKTTTTNKDTV